MTDPDMNDLDTYLQDFAPEDVPAAIAQWLANHAGHPIIGGPAGERPEFVAEPDAAR